MRGWKRPARASALLAWALNGIPQIMSTGLQLRPFGLRQVISAVAASQAPDLPRFPVQPPSLLRREFTAAAGALTCERTS